MKRTLLELLIISGRGYNSCWTSEIAN